MNRYFFILLAATIFISCNAAEKEKAVSNPEPKIAARGDTIEVQISIEGMVESMRMYLLEPPENFPIQFSTYAPAEMVTETVNLENGKSISIMANFGGRLNKNAQLTIFAFPAGSVGSEVHKRVAEIAKSYNAVPGDSALHPWAEKLYDLRGEAFGFLALDVKEGVWFYVLAAYPPQYADGMGPRINLILEKWRWAESGEPLRSQ
ncbi:MAG TPA: hypothetical protein VF181_10575 [Balneolaceae bacterium]